jgi:hypothetical protein
MDLMLILGLGALLLIGAVIAGFVLRRAWGDFPTRAGELPRMPHHHAPPIGGPPPAGPSAPGASPASDDIPDLVPILEPMVRRAAEQALDRGATAARYIVRQGDELFFTFGAIADPVERRAAYELMRRFNAGEQVDIGEAFRLIQRISRE